MDTTPARIQDQRIPKSSKSYFEDRTSASGSERLASVSSEQKSQATTMLCSRSTRQIKHTISATSAQVHLGCCSRTAQLWARISLSRALAAFCASQVYNLALKGPENCCAKGRPTAYECVATEVLQCQPSSGIVFGLDARSLSCHCTDLCSLHMSQVQSDSTWVLFAPLLVRTQEGWLGSPRSIKYSRYKGPQT